MWALILTIVAAALLVLALWAICAVGARADQAIEQMARREGWSAETRREVDRESARPVA